MPPPVLKQAQGEMFREWVTLVLSDRDASRTVSATGAERRWRFRAPKARRCASRFDRATGLPARQVYKETDMGGRVV